MLYVHGFGHFHPENHIDNAFLESLDIGTDDAWIVQRVGIRDRRTVLPLEYLRQTKNRDLRAAQEVALYSNAETGCRAARMAIERAGLSPCDIGLVIAGGCSPDTCIPAEAAAVAHRLGIEVPAFDMHSACSTFGMQVHFVEQLGAAGTLPEFVLLVVPENLTRVTDFSDRSSAILFGDASAAAVVSTKVPSRARAVFSQFGASPAGALEVLIPRTAHFSQNGAVVQKFAIKKMSELLTEVRVRVGSDRQNCLFFVGHQANLTMLEAVRKRAEVAEERHLHNIIHFGNQGAAGAPVVVSQNWDRFREGDAIALVVVGSGLSWSSIQIEFDR